jgi:hypothetical protein
MKSYLYILPFVYVQKAYRLHYQHYSVHVKEIEHSHIIRPTPSELQIGSCEPVHNIFYELVRQNSLQNLSQIENLANRS